MHFLSPVNMLLYYTPVERNKHGKTYKNLQIIQVKQP
jgi:hypothetical protein